MIDTINGFVYKVTTFLLNNWKTSVKVILGMYFLAMGATLLAGIGSGTIPLPTLAMTMPSFA